MIRNPPSAPFKPIVPEPWSQITDNERQVRSRINALLDERGWRRPGGEIASIRTCTPSFYRGVDVWEADVVVDGAFLGTAGFLVTNGGIHPLDGTIKPIQAANAAGALVLVTEDQAKSYVAFQCQSITGDNGDTFWPFDRTQVTQAQADDIAGLLSRPARTSPVLDDSPTLWQVEGVTLYGGYAFLTIYGANGDGLLQMRKDTALIKGMPSVAFEAGLRVLRPASPVLAAP